MNEILVNLADKYPQALRMRDSIIDYNQVEDEENDLIFADGINVKQYILMNVL